MSNERESQSDPRLDCIMFHKITATYRDLKQQYILQSLLAIQNLKPPASFSPPHLHQQRIPILKVNLQGVPPDLQDIQPRPSKVWNYDVIGFDTDDKWNKMVGTYKFFMGERLWITHTGERAPLHA